jgi:hypothetical protein
MPFAVYTVTVSSSPAFSAAAIGRAAGVIDNSSVVLGSIEHRPSILRRYHCIHAVTILLFYYCQFSLWSLGELSGPGRLRVLYLVAKPSAQATIR